MSRVMYYKKITIIAMALVFLCSIFYFLFLSSPSSSGETVRVVVPLKSNGESVNQAVRCLYEEGMIRSRTAFTFVTRVLMYIFWATTKTKPLKGSVSA